MFQDGHSFANAFLKCCITSFTQLKEIDAPVLVMQSADDRSVDPERTQQEVEGIIAEGATNVTLKMMPGLDHGFRDSSGASRLVEQIENAAAIIKTKF